jgi:hypothetical protein
MVGWSSLKRARAAANRMGFSPKVEIVAVKGKGKLPGYVIYLQASTDGGPGEQIVLPHDKVVSINEFLRSYDVRFYFERKENALI